VNCGPTLETKLKSKDEIDKLVANVSTMVKIFEKEKASRSNEEDKKLTEFIQKAKDIVARLQAPPDRTHDGKKGLPKQSKDCFRWTKTGHCADKDKGCGFVHDPSKKGVTSSKGAAKQGKGPDEGGSAPMCALKKCNLPCQWDAKGRKWWTYCSPSSDFGVSTGLISQGYWEQSKWYFVNVERGNISDKLQPRNINVSFSNNSNVPIDIIIFTFYSDQLTIDVETGIVTK
jgi:hypothetical protein